MNKFEKGFLTQCFILGIFLLFFTPIPITLFYKVLVGYWELSNLSFMLYIIIRDQKK